MASGSGSSHPPPPPPSDSSSKLKTAADGDYDSDDEFYYPSGTRDPEIWAKYHKEIEESESFDIFNYPGDCLGVSVVPIRFQNSAFETDLLTKLATVAIQDYNKQNSRTKYQVEKILTANASVCAGIIYYITFEAKERKSRNPAVKTFQAEVWKGIGHITVEFCRLKKYASCPVPPKPKPTA